MLFVVLKSAIVVCIRDSYWVIKGLLISSMTETARGMLSNFARMVDR